MSAVVTFHSAVCQFNDYFVRLDQRKISNKIRDLQLPQKKKFFKPPPGVAYFSLLFCSLVQEIPATMMFSGPKTVS